MEVKAKPCKGTGKAKGHGCGTETKFRKYGLCTSKCYPDFLLNTEEGKELLQKNALIASKRVKKEKDKEQRKEDQATRDRLKRKQDWEKDLEKVFNEFIRLRDAGDPCISCEALPGTYRMSAGHFYPAGSEKSVRFDEDNVHGQCWFNCNKNQHGNLLEYRPRLINKIGEERFEALRVRKNTPAHYSILDIKDMIKIYKAKVKELKNDL